MTDHSPSEDEQGVVVVTNGSCPTWCVTDHGALLAEEDWVHTGEPLLIAGDLQARVCMSTDPTTGSEDGPYVLIGTRELTLEETAELAGSLLALTRRPTCLDPP